jgi:hypothetical protein
MEPLGMGLSVKIALPLTVDMSFKEIKAFQISFELLWLRQSPQAFHVTLSQSKPPGLYSKAGCLP